jgi:hypothetical protein
MNPNGASRAAYRPGVSYTPVNPRDSALFFDLNGASRAAYRPGVSYTPVERARQR